MKNTGKKIFRLLGEMLDYPTGNIVEQAYEAMTILDGMSPPAGTHLAGFLGFCLAKPLTRVKKLYIETFNPEEACCPYIGHHLFTGDESRSMFREKVKHDYASRISYRDERPDHITVMLRSLVVQESVEEARDLIDYCLKPAIKKMIGLVDDASNPYRRVLQAVLLTLETEGDAQPLGP